MGALRRRRFRLQSPLWGRRKGGLEGLQLAKVSFLGMAVGAASPRTASCRRRVRPLHLECWTRRRSSADHRVDPDAARAGAGPCSGAQGGEAAAEVADAENHAPERRREQNGEVAPVASTPAQSAPSVVSHPAQVRPKKAKIRAHKVHRKAPARHPRKAPAVKLAPQATLGASVSFRNQAGPKSTSSFDVSSLVLILGLAIATACFSFALIPARALPWRQVATFRSERQVDMTLIGLALLATTFMLYLMTRA